MTIERTYTVNLSVLLTPVQKPTGRIRVGDDVVEFSLSDESWFNLQITRNKDTNLTLQIEHYGKLNKDPDTAIIIEQIKFNNITSPKFAWAGVYTPNYPPHLQGEKQLSPHTYLGWNGVWRLDFTLPIYTWIHKIEDLGWIHD
jgi:hypothetical protein